MAIVGRPNVGKSSLLNALLGDQRTIVSPVPGTTRDAIDTDLEFDGTPMTLIDTAGLRRPGKRTTTDVEYYSSLRALQALERSHVALVVVDANEGLVDLDLQVAYEAQRAKCATAILFNKWDINADRPGHDRRARQGQGPDEAPLADGLGPHAAGASITSCLWPGSCTGSTARVYPPPSSTAGSRTCGPRDRPAGQGGQDASRPSTWCSTRQSPPRFKVMVNSRALVTKSFAYYLENRLREEYDLWGIPLVIDFEGKEERYS